MAAAWGGWCRRYGKAPLIKNLSPQAGPVIRAGLLEHLGAPEVRELTAPAADALFVPVTQVRTQPEITRLISTLPERLQLLEDTESAAAVQYCSSELIRNALEHSGSPEGAFLCAERSTTEPQRVTIAVADCGSGIANHLARAHAEASRDDLVALGLAMRAGITGALPGMYGTPDNAGAGLFITRSIAKGTGGYFLLVSGTAAYRLRRAAHDEEQLSLFLDPYDEARFDPLETSRAMAGYSRCDGDRDGPNR